MKHLALALLVTVFASFAHAASATIQVKGMVCAFCAQGIEKKFKALPETAKVKVSLETKLVSLDFKDGKDVSNETITKIINDAGYDVLKIERTK